MNKVLAQMELNKRKKKHICYICGKYATHEEKDCPEHYAIGWSGRECEKKA